MKPKRVLTDYLQDILEAAGKARQFVGGIDYDTFSANDEKIYAVTRALEVIGEAAKKVPKSIRDRYPQIPWKDVAGMRDILTHEYFGVDLKRIWKVVQQDLSQLEGVVTQMLADLQTKKSA